MPPVHPEDEKPLLNWMGNVTEGRKIPIRIFWVSHSHLCRVQLPLTLTRNEGKHLFVGTEAHPGLEGQGSNR